MLKPATTCVQLTYILTNKSIVKSKNAKIKNQDHETLAKWQQTC